MGFSTMTAAVRRGVVAAATVGVVASTAIACSSGDSAPGGTSSTSAYSSPTSSSSAAPSSTPVAAGCGAAELSKLTRREKLAQMIVVGVTGTSDAQQVVAKESVGGVFIGSWTDQSILTSGAVKRISAKSKIPLMVTVDEEGGRVSRLKKLGIDSPSARQLAATKTPAQTRVLAASIGKQIRNLGITVDFAPDADVSNEPDDEVIGDRSFSNDPAKVTEYAQAFAQGLADAGVMPVFKHFPGHGHGSGDSHTGTVRTPPLAQLKTTDLVPYRTLLKMPGVGVMVGHLIVPGLTGNELPASVNPRAIAMLRTGKPYGGPAFNGVVFSDDLSGMAAISEKYPVDQAVPMALQAGIDVGLWISTDKVSAVLDALERSMDAKKLTQAQVDRSVVRILSAKGVLKC
ncbi:glycoside hydrolase family 3 N-terminal domain-containing protein [Gordonia asplenii]|uniref:glycoside hydrolase family 3 N-terminal domain-containing protein n=1 Tax=Gordonia asplenii TaxID=2725283 RepID=UPI001FE664BF|nr:glycoside hydrolase family 3 N-terminal domain-containing protein [Gordonia asplenii]